MFFSTQVGIGGCNDDEVVFLGPKGRAKRKKKQKKTKLVKTHGHFDLTGKVSEHLCTTTSRARRREENNLPHDRGGGTLYEPRTVSQCCSVAWVFDFPNPNVANFYSYFYC